MSLSDGVAERPHVNSLCASEKLHLLVKLEPNVIVSEPHVQFNSFKTFLLDVTIIFPLLLWAVIVTAGVSLMKMFRDLRLNFLTVCLSFDFFFYTQRANPDPSISSQLKLAASCDGLVMNSNGQQPID